MPCRRLGVSADVSKNPPDEGKDSLDSPSPMDRDADDWPGIADDWDPLADDGDDWEQAAAPEPVPNSSERLVAAICYGSLLVLPFAIPLIVLVSRTRTRFQHYHAVQSLALAVSVTLLWIAMLLGAGVFGSTLPFIGWLAGGMLLCLMPITWMIAVAVALWAAWQALQGRTASIPLLAEFLRYRGWLPADE